MAYQRLQAGRCLAVIPSDTVDIPNIGAISVSSTTTSAVADKLMDTEGDFVVNRVKVGDIVYTAAIAATVTAIDSATQLTVSTAIPDATAYTIYSQVDNPSNGCALYCGGSGDIVIETMGGDTVTLASVPAGLFIPINTVKKVKAATDATNIIALW